MKYAYISRGPLDSKALEGLEELAHTWPGDVIALAPYVTPHMHARAFDIIDTSDGNIDLRKLRPAVVGALHRPENAYLMKCPYPVVYTSELDKTIRTEQALVCSKSIANKLRIHVGSHRQEHVYIDLAKHAAGLQCNGPLAWGAYARHNNNTIEFNDHRIRADDIKKARHRQAWSGTEPLRVAFSGRIVNVKGAQYMNRIAGELPEFQFAVFGDGYLRTHLQAAAPPNVKYFGSIAFEDWKSYFRECVDVAVLPYPQGDPACTYFEAIGSGVPVIGLQNSTWRRLVSSRQLGWAEPSIDAIIDRLRTVTPECLSQYRDIGLNQMVPFEEVMHERALHLLQSC